MTIERRYRFPQSVDSASTIGGPSRLRLDEAVAQSTVRLDGLRAELAAQSMYLYFDSVALDRGVPAIKRLFNARPRYDRARSPQKSQKHGKFLCGEDYRLTVQQDRSSQGIDGQCTQNMPLTGTCALAPVDCTQTGREFIQVDRLDHVVVGPGIEPGDTIVDPSAGRYDENAAGDLSGT